ncbi:MAG: chloride channel protein [Desulfobacula sp.]|uniref:chloride channel protein n=1 Tax=Desulfobacula sp. TaxID=2593537 RepID=UPI0025BB1C1B|nr:chloride channel protein [Desulfobacula sp.]MCD4720644.1 chloride channel protein [Desulfobacula sp.]
MGFKERMGSGDIAVAGRWLFYFVLIGIIAGCGAIVFHCLCGLGMHFFMDLMAGYRPGAPAGEHLLLPHTQTPFNKWILLILPALGGVVSGWLVYTFAPEAEGHGTDAAIDAYHHKGGLIRGRIPFIKTIASTLTLTTGGSGGREGPIAQIGAGFGSFLATKFKLSERERRIMMAAGIGAGVGSIFRAPLAGALFAAEVLYRDPDFESEVIIPAGISSVFAYCTFCLVFGWGSLFDSPNFKFQNPLELGPYIVLAGVLVLTAILYIKVFYGVIDLFKKFSIPNHLKPAVGGLITGIIGFFLPYTLSFGYGIAQQAIFNQVAIPTLIALALGKIFTTSFSIGSGGSGGVFGPSIVIGGAMGGAVGKIFHLLIPSVVTAPGSFVIVGMAGFFAAASNTPISTIIFISEMTNSYHLLLPSLMVCSICYLLCQRWTIFENQVKSRIDSPAHAGEFMMDILQTIKVGNLRHLIKEVRCMNEDMPFSEFKKIFSSTKQHYFPVINTKGDLSGIFSSNDIREVLFAIHIEQLVVMKDIMVSELICTTPSEDLNTVLLKLTQKNIDALPVMEEEDSDHLIGLIYRRDIISHYNDHIKKIKVQE